MKVEKTIKWKKTFSYGKFINHSRIELGQATKNLKLLYTGFRRSQRGRRGRGLSSAIKRLSTARHIGGERTESEAAEATSLFHGLVLQ